MNKKPENLTKDELEMVVDSIVRILYMEQSADGAWSTNPEKEWSTDELSEIAEELSAFNLVPDGV